MIEAQAACITKLNDDVSRLGKIIDGLQDRIKLAETKAKYWEELQKLIADNPTLASEWKRFCMFIKLSDDEAERRFAAISNSNDIF
jgi:hypothetical protein